MSSASGWEEAGTITDSIAWLISHVDGRSAQVTAKAALLLEGGELAAVDGADVDPRSAQVTVPAGRRRSIAP